MSDTVRISVRPVCDIHKYELHRDNVPAVVDGKTRSGPWANMCEPCFALHGVGLGTGLGQRFILDNIDA